MEKDEFIQNASDMIKRTADTYYDKAQRMEFYITADVNEVEKFEVYVEGLLV